MAMFNVPLVRPGESALRADYNGPNPSQEALEAGKDGSLSLAVPVTAKNKIEAAEIAERENPGWKAIHSDIARNGS